MFLAYLLLPKLYTFLELFTKSRIVLILEKVGRISVTSISGSAVLISLL